jgi:large subunit ribosomal protein L20
MSTKKDIVFKITKGYRGRVNNNWILARRQAVRTLEYQNVSRKLIKRDMRQHWIQQINAATRQFGTSYGQFIHGLVCSFLGLVEAI